MGRTDNYRVSKYFPWLFIVISLLIGLTGTVWGQELNLNQPESIFRQANGYYQKGDYSKAFDQYQQLIAAGYQSGNLYYNLANTYYKLGQKGMAVLYYEKAHRLIPSDADLKANLNYVKNKTENLKGPWHYELRHYLAYLATIDLWAITGLIMFFMLISLFVYALLFPQKLRNDEGQFKPFWLTGMISVGILLFLTISLGTITFLEQTHTRAVMIGQSADVRFEPNITGTLYYQLKEGSLVEIITEKENWFLVKRPDGKRGWVEKRNLERI